MKQHFVLPAPLQGFLPYECLYLCPNNESRTKTITLLGFLLLRVFPFPPAGLPRNLFLSWVFHCLRIAATTLQSIASKKFGMTLSSPPPLPRFATFPTFLILHRSNVSGLPLRDFRTLPPFSISSLKLRTCCRSSSGLLLR